MAQTATIVQPFYNKLCKGKSFLMDYTVSGSFAGSNTFTAQLSDAFGNFNNPYIVGSLTSNQSGSIPVTIPTALTNGVGYRIRIVASAPAIASPDNGANIEIGAAPAPAIVTNNTPVCEGDTIKLKITNVQTGDTIFWSGGMFTSPVIGAAEISFNSALAAMAGTYTIEIKRNTCMSYPTQTVVAVKPRPGKPVATGNSPACEGAPVQLNATTTPPATSYSWAGPGGFNSAQQYPYIDNIPAAGEGWYIVHGVLNDCYSAVSDSVWIDVIPAPKLLIETNSPLCEGGRLQVSASDTGNIVYTWKGPNSFENADSTFSIHNAPVSASGMYFVHTERNGCSNKDSIYLQIKPYPNPTIMHVNDPVCEGDTLAISTVSLSQPGIVSYSFIAPDGSNLGSDKPFFAQATRALAGKYTLVSDINGCVRKDSVQVIVKPTPAITASTSGMVTVENPVQLFANSDIPGTGFYWQGPNGFTSTEQNPVIPSVTNKNKGKYTVTGSFEGCAADTAVEVDYWDNVDYTLFTIDPNPNNGSFTLKGHVLKPQDVEIGIYHAGSGVMIYKNKISSNGKIIDEKITLFNHLAAGEYILKARADDESHGVKFVILQ